MKLNIEQAPGYICVLAKKSVQDSEHEIRYATSCRCRDVFVCELRHEVSVRCGDVFVCELQHDVTVRC